MVSTNVIVRELSKMKEQDFAKFLKRFMKDIKIKQYVFERQEELDRQIKKFYNVLTIPEQNMLHTLNENCLLLSIDYELDWTDKNYLVAYNLERQIVLKKIKEK